MAGADQPSHPITQSSKEVTLTGSHADLERSLPSLFARPEDSSTSRNKRRKAESSPLGPAEDGTAAKRRKPHQSPSSQPSDETHPPTPQSKLEDLIRQDRAIQHYVEYQWNFNRTFQDFDLPEIIVEELSRSRKGKSLDGSASNHTIIKAANRALTDIQTQKGIFKRWSEAWDEDRKMPRLPTSAQLQALRYIQVKSGPGLPQYQAVRFDNAELRWFIDGGSPPAFWHGAQLDDPTFRAAYMAGTDVVNKAAHADASRVANLIKLVFSDGVQRSGIATLSLSTSQQGRGRLRRPVFPIDPANDAGSKGKTNDQDASKPSSSSKHDLMLKPSGLTHDIMSKPSGFEQTKISSPSDISTPAGISTPGGISAPGSGSNPSGRLDNIPLPPDKGQKPRKGEGAVVSTNVTAAMKERLRNALPPLHRNQALGMQSRMPVEDEEDELDLSFEEAIRRSGQLAMSKQGRRPGFWSITANATSDGAGLETPKGSPSLSAHVFGVVPPRRGVFGSVPITNLSGRLVSPNEQFLARSNTQPGTSSLGAFPSNAQPRHNDALLSTPPVTTSTVGPVRPDAPTGSAETPANAVTQSANSSGNPPTTKTPLTLALLASDTTVQEGSGSFEEDPFSSDHRGSIMKKMMALFAEETQTAAKKLKTQFVERGVRLQAAEKRVQELEAELAEMEARLVVAGNEARWLRRPARSTGGKGEGTRGQVDNVAAGDSRPRKDASNHERVVMIARR